MKAIVRTVIGFGDYFMSLSDRTRTQVILLALVMLGGGAVYKLVVSIQNLYKPLPAASPDQLMKPMQKLFDGPRTDNYGAYLKARKQFDSLRHRERSFTPTTLPQ